MPVNVVVPQASSVSNISLVSSTTALVSYSTTFFPVDFFSSAKVTIAVTSCSGTLDVYLQNMDGDRDFGDTYANNFAHFAQWTTATFTTTGTYSLSFVNGGNTFAQTTTIGVAANTVQTVHFGAYWRLSWVVGGSSGESTFAAFGSFR